MCGFISIIISEADPTENCLIMYIATAMKETEEIVNRMELRTKKDRELLSQMDQETLSGKAGQCFRDHLDDETRFDTSSINDYIHIDYIPILRQRLDTTEKNSFV